MPQNPQTHARHEHDPAGGVELAPGAPPGVRRPAKVDSSVRVTVAMPFSNINVRGASEATTQLAQIVAAAIRAGAAGAPPEELRKLADEADELAERPGRR